MIRLLGLLALLGLLRLLRIRGTTLRNRRRIRLVSACIRTDCIIGVIGISDSGSVPRNPLRALEDSTFFGIATVAESSKSDSFVSRGGIA